MQTLQQLVNLFSKLFFSSFQGWMEQSWDTSKEVVKEIMENLSAEEQELTKKLDYAKATKDVTWKWAKQLKEWILNTPEAKDDLDAQETIKLFRLLSSREQQANLDIKKYEKKLWIEPKEEPVSISDNTDSWTTEVKELSVDELKTITNREFLELPDEKRLEYITMKNVDYKSVADWWVKEITFNFDQDWNGRDDTNLYMKTTAWQVLWQEVWEVESWWVTYTRTWLDWEFFNWNKRLVIHTNTEVSIKELRNPEDLAVMEAWISQKFEQYTEKPNSDIAREALERWLDPELSIENFSSLLDWLAENSLERKVKLEEVFTQAERIRDMFKLDIDNPKLVDYLKDSNNDGRIDSFNNFPAKIEWSWEKFSAWYEKYKDLVWEVAANHSRISEQELKWLIDHENRNWDPMISAPWSSAYWLWQMINSTWLEYWKWLDRSNPKDQLEATCRYLDAIMDRQWCSIELAKAYYNTWEWIHSISDAKAKDFASKNPAISKKIKWEINAKSYLTWAVAYYNDISFDKASQMV